MEYEIIKSKKAKNIRLTVKHNGRVILTVPKNVSLNFAKSFVQKKQEWLKNKLEYFKLNPVLKIEKTPHSSFLKHKTEALLLIERKVSEINQYYNFKINKISVKNQNSRWGSCSRKGNLNFNFKVLYLPEDLLKYLVVHELCHLQELNHSAKFWNLVAKIVPNYKVLRKQLLHWSKSEKLL